MVQDAMDKVEIFHHKAGMPVFHSISENSLKNRESRKGLRMSLIKEECEEYLKAEEEDNMVEIADALGDLIYVICGCALEYCIPLDKVYEEIQRSNMTRFREGYRFREDGKLLRSPNWDPPHIKEILDESVQ